MNLYKYTSDKYPSHLQFSKSILDTTLEVFMNDDNLKSVNPDVLCTEFYMKRGKKTLVINIGESWVYGETLPKIDGSGSIGTSIGKYDFGSQLLYTFGPKIACMLDSDFYQYAVPGNCNVKMLSELDRILDYISNNNTYEKIYIIQQFTESNRDHEFRLESFAKPMLSVYESKVDKKLSVPDWLKLYHSTLSDWYQDILNKYSNLNIDAIQWANFCDFETYHTDYSFKRIEPTWIAYSASLESITYTQPYIFNAASFITFEERMSDMITIDIDFANQQLELLDKSYKLIQNNGSMYHNNHPNPFGHAVWATYLVRQAGWKDV